ncbi:MAG: FAD-binding oxidoreductase [Rhodospirillaceae bacterium]|nr:FAD-binding oxidoreductase [Rhodospirillaceae bacterium]
MSDPARRARGAEDLADRIAAIVGEAHCIRAPEAMAPYLTDWRGLFRGRARLVARPGSTAEVAAVVRLCAEARVPIVPQGGNTGYMGGATPSPDGDAVVVSLARMNRVRAIDAANYTMTVEAGRILQQVQEAAAEADRLFPLSLGAEGTCQIGGNLSTNAGGIAVLRYGNMRDLTLGLEVVLPDGSVWDGLRALRKDNTGYDLKHLFIGAEGTLGIITAAVLKLFPQPRARVTVFAAVRDLEAALALLSLCRTATGDALVSFELVPRIGIELALKHVPGTLDPFPQPYDVCLLIEATAGVADSGLRAALESALASGLEEGLVLDALFAESEAQTRRLWHLREAIVEGQRLEGGNIKHDIAVPVSKVPAFIAQASAAASAIVPGAQPVAFGHLGDGNVHFNLAPPPGTDPQAFLAAAARITPAVHEVAAALGGSISAEHGLGQLKRDEITRFKSAVEIELMRSVKRALDPLGIMNPGKVVTVG